MNIIFISENEIFLKGGTSTYVREISKRMAERGESVHLLYPLYGETLPATIEGVDCVPMKMGKATNYRNDVSRLMSAINDNLEFYIRKWNIDVIHILSAWHSFFLFDARKAFVNGAEVFITIHNVPPQESPMPYRGNTLLGNCICVIKNWLRCAASLKNIHSLDKRIRIIVPCDNVEKRLKKYQCHNEIFVIHHGYNDELLKLNPLKIEEDKSFTKLLCVGGIAPHKNQGLLIEILKDLPNRNRFKLYLIGGTRRNPDYADVIKKRISEYRLENEVEMIIGCSDEDLCGYYKNADIYIQPSLHEGFCFTALDAAAFGLQVIGSDVGEIAGIAELSNGRVCRYNNLYDFRKAIIELSNGDRKGNPMAIKETYCWDKAIFQMQHIYKNSKYS